MLFPQDDVLCVAFPEGDGLLFFTPGDVRLCCLFPRVMFCCVVFPQGDVPFSSRVTLCGVFTQGDDLLCFYSG